MSDLSRPVQPSLILIRGLPGSGKSSLASALADRLGRENVAILDPDHIDQDSAEYKSLCDQLTDEGVDPKFFPNRFLKAKGYQAIAANKVIIWNQAFTDFGGFSRSVASLQDYAAEHGTDLPALLVEVEIDPATAKERVRARSGRGGHSVPEDTFARFIADYQSFADKGHTAVIVNGNDSADASAATVLSALGQIQKT
ncbi:MAG TPA: ATP-binding protein [Candidatus Saccharimonadales bacterium]|nr:ATP-binding protein [Candidatus Saccharimonadales bacterium]